MQALLVVLAALSTVTYRRRVRRLARAVAPPLPENVIRFPPDRSLQSTVVTEEAAPVVLPFRRRNQAP